MATAGPERRTAAGAYVTVAARRRLARVLDVAAMVALILGMTACTRLSPPSPAAEREEGERLYQRACASCHGLDAHGGGPVVPALRVPPPDLTTLAARHGGIFPRAYVADVVAGRVELAAHGTREMPVWNDRFGSGPGNVASLWERRRVELVTDHLAALQRSP